MSGMHMCGREWLGESIFISGWDVHIKEWGIWSVWCRGTYFPIGYWKIRGLTLLIVEVTPMLYIYLKYVKECLKNWLMLKKGGG